MPKHETTIDPNFVPSSLEQIQADWLVLASDPAMDTVKPLKNELDPGSIALKYALARVHGDGEMLDRIGKSVIVASEASAVQQDKPLDEVLASQIQTYADIEEGLAVDPTATLTGLLDATKSKKLKKAERALDTLDQLDKYEALTRNQRLLDWFVRQPRRASKIWRDISSAIQNVSDTKRAQQPNIYEQLMDIKGIRKGLPGGERVLAEMLADSGVLTDGGKFAKGQTYDSLKQAMPIFAVMDTLSAQTGQQPKKSVVSRVLHFRKHRKEDVVFDERASMLQAAMDITGNMYQNNERLLDKKPHKVFDGVVKKFGKTSGVSSKDLYEALCATGFIITENDMPFSSTRESLVKNDLRLTAFAGQLDKKPKKQLHKDVISRVSQKVEEARAAGNKIGREIAAQSGTSKKKKSKKGSSVKSSKMQFDDYVENLTVLAAMVAGDKLKVSELEPAMTTELLLNFPSLAIRIGQNSTVTKKERKMVSKHEESKIYSEVQVTLSALAKAGAAQKRLNKSSAVEPKKELVPEPESKQSQKTVPTSQDYAQLPYGSSRFSG